MVDFLDAWDVMSQITLSTTFGMIETGSDNLKILDASRKTVDYFASVRFHNAIETRMPFPGLTIAPMKIGQMPSLDIIMDKNPINSIGRPLLKWAVAVAAEAYQKRKKEETPLNRNPDFLDRYIEAENKHPDVVNGNTVMMYMLSNLAAGSDTTATSMCGAIYYVLKHPAVYTRLKEELSSTKLSTPVQWKEIRGLSYLDAVMREAMRVHPGISLPLERLAPKGGFTLPDGRFIAEDTIVGMNPWVINRDPVFGADPDSFIPEWWLPGKGESDEMFQARFLKMKSASFTFGGGSRICLGQFVSVLESYKFVATLFDQFDVSSFPLEISI